MIFSLCQQPKEDSLWTFVYIYIRTHLHQLHTWAIHLFQYCSQRTEPSCIIIRLLCNSPDKTLYDVTFARRFWHGKQIIVCEQTRLFAIVLVGCFIKVSQG